MPKKSLVISDSEKYGSGSPAVAMSDSPKKPEDRKSAPTIELTGKQVDAFCACSLAVGDKGTATIHYVVKASSAGDSYGSELPTKDSKKKVTLSITHVEADKKDGDEEDEEKGEDPKEEASETPEEESSEESAETPEPEGAEDDGEANAGQPVKGKKTPISVKGSGLDDV